MLLAAKYPKFLSVSLREILMTVSAFFLQPPNFTSLLGLFYTSPTKKHQAPRAARTYYLGVHIDWAERDSGQFTQISQRQ